MGNIINGPIKGTGADVKVSAGTTVAGGPTGVLAASGIGTLTNGGVIAGANGAKSANGVAGGVGGVGVLAELGQTIGT